MEFIKRYRIWIVLVLLVLPVALRGLWFYQGFKTSSSVSAPNYASNIIPQPPISTSAPDQSSLTAGRVVVVDFQHGNQFAPSEIDTFTAALTRRGVRVEFSNYDLSLASQLKYASAYVVIAPSYSFTADEVTQVRNFVLSGGRLMVFTDPTRGTTSYNSDTGASINLPDADFANNLLAPFGISVNNDYLYDLVKSEGNFRNVPFGTFASHALTSGLGNVVFYGVHSVETASGTPLIIGDGNTYSSLTDNAGTGRVAAALSADGNVLALGDFSFLVPPYNTVADNQILLRNLADYVLGGTRTHSVADFPFVFDRTVTVIPTSGLQLTSDMLEPFASLQNTLRLTSISMVMGTAAPTEGDLLIIGSLTPGDDLLPYIEPFHLGLDDSSLVVIPGLGAVSRSGVGLLLYKHTPTRNTLILLTDVSDDLPALVSLLSSGDLSSCVIQEDIGVCSIGSNNDYYYYEPTSEPTMFDLSPTPTPSG